MLPQIVIRFGAHLGHLLNHESAEPYRLDVTALWKRIRRSLAGPPRAAQHDFRDRLVCHWLVGDGEAPEHSAAQYINAVLDRPISTIRKENVQAAHRFFLALCQRGYGDVWRDAQLVRLETEPPARLNAPDDLLAVAAHLKRFAGKRAGDGLGENGARAPLYLRTGRFHLEVPEQLSLWKAIQSAPPSMEPLTGAALTRFSTLTVKALGTANSYYGAVISMGLSPYKWDPAKLSNNTAKDLSAFLNAARAPGAKGGQRLPDTIETWREAWATRQVPWRKSADELWNSELGQAVRETWRLYRPVEYYEGAGVNEFLDDANRDPSNHREDIQRVRRAGAINDFQFWLWEQIVEHGLSLPEIFEANPDHPNFQTFEELQVCLNSLLAALEKYLQK